MMRFTHDCRGGVIIWVFIMVAAFAALTYVVSSSFRLNTSANIDKEKMELYASSIMSYSDALRTQVALLVQINKVPDLKLDFANDINKLQDGSVNCWNNNSACNDASCAVFQPQNPQGIQPRTFEEVASTASGTSSYRTKGGHGIALQMVIEGQGTSASDLVYFIRGIDPAFCNFYNKQLGITTNYTSTTILADVGETDQPVSGYFGGCGTPGEYTSTARFGDQETRFKGMKTFCAPYDFNSEQNRLAIYNILLAR